MTNFKGRFSSAVLAATLIWVLAACSRPPSLGKVGERLEYGGYAMTVLNVEFAKTFPGARRALAGETLVAVELLIESNANNVQVSPTHMWVIESGGKEHRVHITGHAPILQAQANLPKGQRVQGWLTFAAPEGATNLHFVNELPKEFNHVLLKVALN